MQHCRRRMSVLILQTHVSTSAYCHEFDVNQRFRALNIRVHELKHQYCLASAIMILLQTSRLPYTYSCTYLVLTLSTGSSWTPASPVVFTGIPTEKMTGLKLKMYLEGSPDVSLPVKEVDASEWFYLTFSAILSCIYQLYHFTFDCK